MYSTVDRIVAVGKRIFFLERKKIQICVVLLESVPMSEESKEVLMINILFEVRSFIHR